MVKIWNPKDDGDPKVVGELASQLNIDYTLANLLIQRGITNFVEAKKFFRPDLKNLHDPFLMKDMDKAVERLNQAIKLQEKILVYGDYDVDGTTAVSLVYSFFKIYNSNIDFYIPDRYTEGYGISTESIDFAHENGFTLIIALDCGIKASDKIDYAKSKGIDFIIGDHHRPDNTIPEAYAVLDPKQPECQYPYKDLSGCGVAYKMIQAFSKKNKIPMEKAYDFLDLVVISIASDIVPITGENRIFAYYGLRIINTKPRPGIEAILACAKVTRRPRQIYTHNKSIFSKELTINDLVFTIGPRINAAGRLENGKTSVELLNSDNLEDAKIIAERINDINNERRNLDNIATQDAIEDLENDPKTIYKKTTVVYNPDWYKGVVGIVASRLTEKYYRPTIVFTKSNGLITGSARSIKNFDIYDAINACSDLLEHFGGHTYAAGLSLKEENLSIFIERFEQIVTETIDDQMLIPVIDYDTDLDLKDINTKFYKTLKSFAPFGPGNQSPVFRTTGVVDTGLARIVGKNHIKLTVTQLNKGGYPISAIAFQQGDYFDQITGGLPFNIVYHIEENEWNNTISLQLNIKDIKIIE
ncbi:MAG: single-stranded-DNA-specific exonuclease RecJ [Bacteroidales bacterium]|jgi:single-stranded-DNA-specific exonuclease|nr:single-stranded-DNA-specific exonuclease RecJ [Bacteroidales bacterium]